MQPIHGLSSKKARRLTTDKSRFEGKFRVNYCPRGRDECESLSQIIADEHSSFVCCGEVKEHARSIPQDRYRLCWKNPVVDEMGEYDKRDLIDQMSVIAQAISIIEEADCAAYHDPDALDNAES